MYDLALSLNESSLYEIAKTTFLNMKAVGITSVGEFHYLHHEFPLEHKDSKPYNFDKVIIKAARDAQIRLVLLLTYYEQSSVFPEKNQLETAQKRFETPSMESFWKNFDELHHEITKENTGLQSLGVCAHSIRGVKLSNIALLRQEAEKRGVPFHIHLEEQPQEIKDCIEVYGKRPSELLLGDAQRKSENITLVHCTHTLKEDLKKWTQDKQANICVCPLTEGNLGDGVFPFLEEDQGQSLISFGSDCNYRLCFFEEMRWFLYCQQMRNVCRGLNKQISTPNELFPLLLKYATINGAKALGLDSCGAITPGYHADFFTIDLENPHFSKYTKDNLLENLILACSSESIISGTCVNGLYKAYKENESFIEKREPLSFKTTTGKIEGVKIEEFLYSMVQVPSTTGSEQMFGLSLAEYFEEKNWVVHKQFLPNTQRFNLYVHHPNISLNGPKVLLNSHLDTVPPHISASFEGDCLKGRGSCDAKGQIACQVFAFEALLQAFPQEIASSVALLYVVGEEVDHIGMLEANSLGVCPEYMIVGEPTELKLAFRQKGILKIKLVSQGKPAHSGYPDRGIDAMGPMLDVLQDLKSEKWIETAELGKTTLNIGVIQGGKAANVVPDNVEAVLAFRLVTDPESILQRVEQIVKNRVKIEKLTCNGPLNLEIVDGIETDIVAFNTDIPYFAGFTKGKTKALLYGAGSITDAHSPWEFVKIDDLKKGAAGYQQIIKKILSLK